MSATVNLSLAECEDLCRKAAMRAGAGADAALAIARAAVAAEAEGNMAVGLSHFVSYLEALEAGRIAGRAEPVIERPAPALILSDARDGTAHLGYDRAHPLLVEAARLSGVAVFSQKNSYTCGALGYFAARLAAEGLVAMVTASGPAVMTVEGGSAPVYCTNPLAFAAPMEPGPPLLIDQSSSQTAFVKVVRAAERGETIPEGWAIGPDGKPTTDPDQAIKGALIAFGGARGANIALMVEVLSAGLSGAGWALDAPPFASGHKSPRAGMFVLAINPALFGDHFAERLRRHMRRLQERGVHVPGQARLDIRGKAETDGLTLPKPLYDRLSA